MTGRRMGLWLSVGCLIVAFLPLHLGPPAFASPAAPKRLTHAIPPAVLSGYATLLGRRAPTATIELAVGLTMRDRVSLDQFLASRRPGQRPLNQAQANATFNPTSAQQ